MLPINKLTSNFEKWKLIYYLYTKRDYEKINLFFLFDPIDVKFSNFSNASNDSFD